MVFSLVFVSFIKAYWDFLIWLCIQVNLQKTKILWSTKNPTQLVVFPSFYIDNNTLSLNTYYLWYITYIHISYYEWIMTYLQLLSCILIVTRIMFFTHSHYQISRKNPNIIFRKYASVLKILFINFFKCLAKFFCSVVCWFAKLRAKMCIKILFLK